MKRRDVTLDYGVLALRQGINRAHDVLGIDETGKQRLLYSLRQLEYLQYYIHHMRLTDPAWVMSFTCDEQPRGADKASVLPLVGDGNEDWLPLPNTVMKANFFTKLVSRASIPKFYRRVDGCVVKESIHFESRVAIKKLLNQVYKHNRKLEAEQLRAFPTSSMINREEAKIDNATPGPGLRNGPPRRRPSRSRCDDEKETYTEDKADKETTGWGGFPFKKAEKETIIEAVCHDDVTEHQAKRRASSMGSEATPSSGIVSDSNIEDASAIIRDEGETELGVPIKDLASKDATAKLAHKVENFTSNYYYHAQQALIVGSLGGLRGALEASPDEAGPPAEIGRSLFLALDVTTWETDTDVVLEVGWAALWWADSQDGIKEDGGIEETREQGHYM